MADLEKHVDAAGAPLRKNRYVVCPDIFVIGRMAHPDQPERSVRTGRRPLHVCGDVRYRGMSIKNEPSKTATWLRPVRLVLPKQGSKN